MLLEARVTGTPPSANSIYRSATIRAKGKVWTEVHLTPEAKRYKKEVVRQLLASSVEKLRQFEPDVAYYVTLVFHLQVLTKGWPKTAKNRFVQEDVSNLIKLLEDAVKEVTQVDDSLTFELIVCKRQLRQGEEPYVEIFIGKLEDRDWLP